MAVYSMRPSLKVKASLSNRKAGLNELHESER